MRILVLANFGMGLYNFRKELLEHLMELGYEVYVSSPFDEYIPKLEKLGCKVIETPLNRRGKNPFADLYLLINYLKIIKRIKPFMVLTYTIKPNVYGGLACRMTHVPYLPNITGVGTAIENGGLLQKITLFLYKVSLKKATCVFFQNIENKELFKSKKIVYGNFKVIPGSGVNLTYYTLMNYPTDQKIVFLFVSRVMKEKGIDQYLEAAAYIKQKYPNTSFHIVGFCEEEYEHKLIAMQEKGIIKYHGKQSDVRPFYKQSHCIVHPTYYPEGMSNVLLESAACGRPIITTNRSGCKEIVEDGVNGYVVEQQNSKDLINKIETFLSLDYEEKRRMGLAGRKKVEKEFDRNHVIQAYIQVLQSAQNE